MKRIILLLVTIMVINVDNFAQVNNDLEYIYTNMFGIERSALNSVKIQSDGKVVSCGYNFEDSMLKNNLLLFRYNQDGTLDEGFGINGIVLTGFGSRSMAGHSISILPDNRILVCGLIYQGSFRKLFLIRYQNDGSIDSSFGDNGKVILDYVPNEIYACPELEMQDDGKILVSVRMKNLVDDGFVFFRFNENGTLDDTFGDGGKVKTVFNGNASAYSLKVQENGKIILTGVCSLDGLTACYNPDGSLDTSFGEDGSVFEDGARFESVLLQPNGRCLVTGTVIDTVTWWSKFLLIRYNQDGTIDDSFGVNGKVITAVNARVGKSYIQDDSKILQMGYIEDDIILLRYLPDGSLDNSFGENGKKIVSNNENLEYNPYSLTMNSNGNIYIVGGVQNYGVYRSTDYNLMLCLDNNGDPDSSFNLTGRSIIDFESIDYANTVERISENHIIAAGFSDSTFAMVKYNINFSLDKTFGRCGVVTLNLGGVVDCAVDQQSSKITLIGDSYITRFTDAGVMDSVFGTNGIHMEDSVQFKQCQLTEDGKIIIAGNTTLAQEDFVIYCFNSDGTPDTTFGDGGKTISDLGYQGDFVSACALQGDGKVVVAGNVKVNDVTDLYENYDIAMVRYNPNGTVDNSFGSNGILITSLSEYVDKCYSICIQPNGKILCTGSTNEAFYIVRYEEDGSLDQSFGDNGVLISEEIGYVGNKVCLQYEEMILALVDNNRVVRFTANGILDENFPSSDIFTHSLDFYRGQINDVTILDNDFISLVGSWGLTSQFSSMVKNEMIFVQIPPEGYSLIDEQYQEGLALSVSPNPINEEFTVHYSLEETTTVSICLTDLYGRVIQNLEIDEFKSAGMYSETYLIDGVLPAGIYFVSIITPYSNASIKVLKH